MYMCDFYYRLRLIRANITMTTWMHISVKVQADVTTKTVTTLMYNIQADVKCGNINHECALMIISFRLKDVKCHCKISVHGWFLLKLKSWQYMLDLRFS